VIFFFNLFGDNKKALTFAAQSTEKIKIWISIHL